MDNCFLKTSPSVLSRESDDGTILVLSETSGRAFVLGTDFLPLWKALKAGVMFEQLQSVAGDGNPFDYESTIQMLVQARVIVVDGSEDLPAVFANEGHSGPSNMVERLSVSQEPMHSSSAVVTEIEFGACDCSGGYANLVRWISCNWGGDNRTSSIVF